MWEYRVETIPEDANWQDWLNELGKDRWELISFLLSTREHVFKRPSHTGGYITPGTPYSTAIVSPDIMPHELWEYAIPQDETKEIDISMSQVDDNNGK